MVVPSSISWGANATEMLPSSLTTLPPSLLKPPEPPISARRTLRVTIAAKQTNAVQVINRRPLVQCVKRTLIISLLSNLLDPGAICALPPRLEISENSVGCSV